MDPITHAASGAVAMLALPMRPASRWAVPLAALAALSPDMDVALAHTPLQFLLLHRGITHSLFFSPLLGLVPALAACALWRPATRPGWSFGKIWLFMTSMVLLHIWLDCITTYGTMIFTPFSHARVRLNAVFIIDALLTLPLLWALWRWRARRALLVLTLAWVFAYPAVSMGLKSWHTARIQEYLAATGHKTDRLVVLPDAFAPLFWRALYEETGPQGTQVRSQGLNALGQPRGPAFGGNAALPPAMGQALARQSAIAKAFLEFTLLPVISPLPPDFLPPDAAKQDQPDGTAHANAPPRYIMIYDLRFGSNLDFVRTLLSLRPHAEIPFKYMAELAPDPSPQTGEDREGTGGFRLVRERLRFSDSGQDSLWQPPEQFHFEIALTP